MEKISFKSRIKPLTLAQYAKISGQITSKYSVNYPWTLKESIKAKDVYTTNIADCTACLITDGNEAVLMHLSPDREINHAFSLVLNFLRAKLDLKNENLQSVLFGSKNTQKSQDIYNKFKALMQQLNIPCSELKNSKNKISVAYKTSNDTVFVTSETIDNMLKKGKNNEDVIKSGFEKVSLADCDEIDNAI